MTDKMQEERSAVTGAHDAVPSDTARYVSAFFDELIRAGVRDVVVSPGSRSTPLAMVAYASPLNLYLDVDERGAGFFALGMAKATGRAVALICTSGTALANYYPCVLEAEASRVPLIILSGDRPAHLQKVGAPQTCDQLHAFSTHVRTFWQMPAPSSRPEIVAYARQIAREAYNASGAGTLTAAPVHLNFPFDEPLKPNLSIPDLFEAGRGVVPALRHASTSMLAHVGNEGNEASAKVTDATATLEGEPVVMDFSAMVTDLPAKITGRTYLAADQAQQLDALLRQCRVIALCGEGTLGVLSPGGQGEYDSAEVALAFAEEYDIPLLADPLSQLRSYADAPIIDNYDNILARKDCPPFNLVLRFGRYPISKRLTSAIQAAGCPQVVVDPLESRDFNASTTTLVALDPLDFMASLLECAGSSAPSNADSTCDYIARWAELNHQEAARIRKVEAEAPTAPIMEGAYVQTLIDCAPEQSLLFVGNSMPIRAVDTFYLKQDKQLYVMANRGLNGIDGTLSSALGAAQSFEQAFLLTGDLTLIHDLNAFALQNEMLIREATTAGYQRPSIIVVLLNNSGGAIFDMLPQSSDEPYFERLFLTPHAVDFAAAAQTFGVSYAKAHTPNELRTTIAGWTGSPGIHLVEVPVALRGVRERYAPYVGVGE